MQPSVFEQRPRTGIAKMLQRANTDLLAQSVGMTYFAYDKSNMEPGAEKWSRCFRHRHQIMEAVFRKWSELSGKNDVFPWSEDYVVFTWVGFRKMTDADKCKWKEWIHGST